MYIGDRKEREEYMDDLERQMEDQREQIQRTLDRMADSGRRGGALERLRGSIPRFPARALDRRNLEETREDAPQYPDSLGPDAPLDASEGLRTGSEPRERSWWRRMFGP